MTLRSRVLLILFGIVVFLAAAPTILFLAQGYGFNFDSGRLVKTGTLVVKTEPRDAAVFLNGQPLKNTPLVKRFLYPGEYSLEIMKPGYRTWKKQIRIHEQQVTFVPVQPEKVNLLGDVQPKQILADRVLDFYAADNANFFLKADGIYRITPGNPAIGVASTTAAFLTGRIVEARESSGLAEFIITDEKTYWYLSHDKFFVLPKLSGYAFGSAPATVLGIDAKNQLWEISSGGRQKLLRGKLSAFKVLDNTIYFVTAEAIPKLGQMSDLGQEIILSELPDGKAVKIIVSPERQIFLLQGSHLYELSDVLKKINDNVNYAVWDRGAAALVYGNGFESWIYDPLAREANKLLTRSSTPITTPFYHEALGYAFFADDHVIKAIEVDFSGQPNVYLLAELSEKNAKLSVDELGRFLVGLDGKNLFLLPLR